MLSINDRYKIEKRTIQRDGFCRGCDTKLTKGDEIIYTYSFRNRGQSIIFCCDCARVISGLVSKHD